MWKEFILLIFIVILLRYILSNLKSRIKIVKNKENTDKLFNNIKSFFNKFYKDSGIDNFLKENKDLKTDLESILSDGREVEAFCSKYKNMPDVVKNTIANYFKKETTNILEKYIKTETSLNSNNFNLLTNICNNISAINQLGENKDFVNLYVAIEKVLGITNNFNNTETNNVSVICNFLINSAIQYHKSNTTLLEDSFVKLLCDFIKANRSIFKEDKFKDFIETFKKNNENLGDSLSERNIEKLFSNVPDLNPNYKSNTKKVKDAFTGTIGLMSKKFQNFRGLLQFSKT